MLHEITAENSTTLADIGGVLNHTSDLHSRLHDEQLYDVPVGLLVLLSVLYGTISILAVIGNTLVIWIVATTRQMQSVTNLFIANLALADVIIGMFAIPFQFQAAVLQRWILPDFMCAFCPYVQMVSVNVSVFTLTAIAVDRHRAIINPLRARPPKYVCKIAICLIWIVSVVFAVPIAIAMQVIEIPETLIFADGEKLQYTKHFCDNVNLTWDQMKRYRYSIVLFQYVVPFCVISFVYIQMAVRLWGTRTPGNAQDSRDVTLMRNKKRVIKMLIIVVLLFGLCWFPLQLYQMLQVTYTAINEYRYINIVWFCSDWLAMSNSCYNPFIYGIYNEKFKREFQRRFPIFRPARPDGPSTEASDQTVSVYTRTSSVRMSSHLHNNNHQGTQRKPLRNEPGTQRSCSFNFIGQTSGADIKLEPITWLRNSVTFDQATTTASNGSSHQQRTYPKVMFQPVCNATPADDCDGDVNDVSVAAAASVCARCARSQAATSNGALAHRCECFEKSKRYSDEFVQL